jgi:dTDP-4-dehydrorhamnose 3,5-epimerase
MVITSEWSDIPKIISAFSFSDPRGQLAEVAEVAVPSTVNVKVSTSRKGVLRGLHYQVEPYQQAKIIRVCSGRILDVAVDLKSGDLYEVALGADDNCALYIPAGYAHGFEAIANDSVVVYISTNCYMASSERAYSPHIEYFDTFSWQGSAEDLVVSSKDRNAPKFEFGPLSRHYRYIENQWTDASTLA